MSYLVELVDPTTGVQYISSGLHDPNPDPDTYIGVYSRMAATAANVPQSALRTCQTNVGPDGVDYYTYFLTPTAHMVVALPIQDAHVVTQYLKILPQGPEETQAATRLSAMITREPFSVALAIVALTSGTNSTEYLQRAIRVGVSPFETAPTCMVAGGKAPGTGTVALDAYAEVSKRIANTYAEFKWVTTTIARVAEALPHDSETYRMYRDFFDLERDIPPLKKWNVIEMVVELIEAVENPAWYIKSILRQWCARTAAREAPLELVERVCDAMDAEGVYDQEIINTVAAAVGTRNSVARELCTIDTIAATAVRFVHEICDDRDVLADALFANVDTLVEQINPLYGDGGVSVSVLQSRADTLIDELEPRHITVALIRRVALVTELIYRDDRKNALDIANATIRKAPLEMHPYMREFPAFTRRRRMPKLRAKNAHVHRNAYTAIVAFMYCATLPHTLNVDTARIIAEMAWDNAYTV